MICYILMSEEQSSRNLWSIKLKFNWRVSLSHIPYVYYHMLSFYHQSQWDYKSWSPPVATDQTVLRNFPGRPGNILSLFAFSLFSICLRFTREEIKRLYRGFKTECPTGILRFFLLTMIRITRHSCQFYKKKIELTVKPLSIDYWHGWMPW